MCGVQFLADIFIKVEGDLRRENEKKEHGWSGFKILTVKKKVRHHTTHPTVAYTAFVEPMHCIRRAHPP